MRAAQAFYSVAWCADLPEVGSSVARWRSHRNPMARTSVLVWVARKTSPQFGKSPEVEAMHSLPLMAGFMVEVDVFGFPNP